MTNSIAITIPTIPPTLKSSPPRVTFNPPKLKRFLSYQTPEETVSLSQLTFGLLELF